VIEGKEESLSNVIPSSSPEEPGTRK